AEVWTTKPFQLPGFSYERMMRGTSFLRVIARMKPGMTLAQVKAGLPSLDQSYRTQYSNKIDSSLVTTVRTLPEDVTQNFRAGFITLFAAVSFVLLIACSNVANLLLVRFSGRRRVIALGMAIGASRARVDGLKEGGRGTSGSLRQQRFRRILVGAQVALSLTLLAGAALLITSFVRLTQQNVGFRSQNLWTGAITLPVSQYADAPSRQRFAEQTLDALRDVPGIESATISGDIPLNGGNRTLYARGDREVPPIEKRANAPSHDMAPGYFRTWGIPLLAGREFNEHDTADSQKVCLISQAGAKKVY